jgi:hypothetical protein
MRWVRGCWGTLALIARLRLDKKKGQRRSVGIHSRWGRLALLFWPLSASLRLETLQKCAPRTMRALNGCGPRGGRHRTETPAPTTERLTMTFRSIATLLSTIAAGATLAIASLSLAEQAQAQTAGPAATPRVDQRQANQDRRIDQGVASGQLTRREAGRLQSEQARIDRAEGRAKADGKVTAAERKRLDRKQDHASRHIAGQKHDAQHRPGAPAAGK